MVKFECCEVKDKIDSSILATPSGNGRTWDEAVKDYSEAISGKLLVFDAYGDNRTVFQCPTLDPAPGEKRQVGKVLDSLSDWLIDKNATLTINGKIVGIEELFFQYVEDKGK
jgi:hypothetical protein